MTRHEITVAKHAGFCFGVKRATDMIAEKIAAHDGDRIFTLGKLIHNDTYNAQLAADGVGITSIEELEALAKETENGRPVTVFVRAHGVTKETSALLDSLSDKYQGFSYVDCTCPYVKKIHRIAAENCVPRNEGEEPIFVLIGAETHPEVVGIMSYFDGEKYVFASAEELESSLSQWDIDKMHKKTPVMVAQTTQNLGSWNKSQQIIKKLYTNAEIFDTICSVTELRQTEAAQLAQRCDCIIVIGGRESSNTAKLYEICRKNCGNTVWISCAAELTREMFSHAQHIGIVAGASTPSDEIQEVYKTMSEMKENFEELLESQCLTLNTGDVVTGTVTHVSDAELQLDVGAGVTGYIKADQISNDPAFKLTENFKNGD